MTRYIISCLAVVLMSMAATTGAGVRTNSALVLSTQPASAFAATNLIDSDPATVWVEGKPDSGLGETISLDLPRCVVKRVRVFPGHGADERMFRKYSHLKEVTLSLFTVTNDRSLKEIRTIAYTFQDTFGLQEIAVPDVSVGDELFGGQAQIQIKSVYPGIDFKDTAVGEILIELDEFPAQLEVTEAPPVAKASSNENLVDGSTKTLWTSDSAAIPAQFTLNAPDFGLMALVIQSGDPAATGKFQDFARPKELKIEIDGRVINHTLKDSSDVQRIEFPRVNGFTGSLFGLVKVTVISVYPGKKSQTLSIAEFKLIATHLAL